MNKWCCAKCALTVRVTWGMHRACVEDKWRSGAATGWRCSLKMSSAASACSCRCHWVFTEAPLCSPPLCPVKRGGKKKKADKPLMRAPLISLGRLCSAFFLPSSSFCWGAVKSSEDSVCPLWSLVVPDCLLALSSVMAAATAAAATQSQASAKQPPPSLSRASSESEMPFSCSLVGTEASFLTVNS